MSMPLPSSQTSPGSTMPLPQVGRAHVAVQPSPETRLPSSQASTKARTMPSPQRAKAQPGTQASVTMSLASSHASPGSTRPSPQRDHAARLPGQKACCARHTRRRGRGASRQRDHVRSCERPYHDRSASCRARVAPIELFFVGGPNPRFLFALAIAIASPLACSSSKDTPDASAPAPSASQAAPPPTTAAPAQPLPLSPAERQGRAITRSRQGDALFVADEDHKVLRRIPLPLAPDAAVTEVPLPGAPAQVLAIDGAVLVTIRDPGLLLVLRPDASGSFVETKRVPLPGDAWGLAVTADASLAIVTSAWTHKVSAVDLRTHEVRWTVDVAREPRGVVVRKDGRSAYITHLTGAALTRIDAIESATPTVRRVEFAPSPLRTPVGKTLNASLGYALVFSPDEGLLFAPRHALGALGEIAWFGAATVDVLVTSSDKGLAPLHRGHTTLVRAEGEGPAPELRNPRHAPRGRSRSRATSFTGAAPIRCSSRGKGTTVVEVDALAVDPTISVVRRTRWGASGIRRWGSRIAEGRPRGSRFRRTRRRHSCFAARRTIWWRSPLSRHASRGRAGPGRRCPRRRWCVSRRIRWAATRQSAGGSSTMRRIGS